MNNTVLPQLLFIVLLSLPCGSCVLAADVTTSDDEIQLESSGTEVDAVTKQLTLPKIHISQAGYEIQAELGQAKGLNFDNSEWIFTGKVKITTPQGSSSADRATVQFVQNKITELHISGRPATFEQHTSNRQTQVLAQGHADNIDYYLKSNSIRLQNNAWIKYGQNEFTGRTMVYDITHQRILANPNEQEGERVRILITPDATKNKAESSTSSGSQQP